MGGCISHRMTNFLVVYMWLCPQEQWAHYLSRRSTLFLLFDFRILFSCAELKSMDHVTYSQGPNPLDQTLPVPCRTHDSCVDPVKTTGPTSWNAQLVSWDNLIHPTGTLSIHWAPAVVLHEGTYPTPSSLGGWGTPPSCLCKSHSTFSFLMASTCSLVYILFIFSLSSILIAQGIDKGTEVQGKVWLLHCPNCWPIDMISCLCGHKKNFYQYK